MSKSFFTGPSFEYSREATELDLLAGQWMESIFAEYVELGYSPREIAHILMGAIWERECMAIFDLRDKHKGAK